MIPWFTSRLVKLLCSSTCHGYNTDNWNEKAIIPTAIPINGMFSRRKKLFEGSDSGDAFFETSNTVDVLIGNLKSVDFPKSSMHERCIGRLLRGVFLRGNAKMVQSMIDTKNARKIILIGVIFRYVSAISVWNVVRCRRWGKTYSRNQKTLWPFIPYSLLVAFDSYPITI